MSDQSKARKNPWSPEKLAGQARPGLETIRANALRLNATDLIAMCDAELAKRGGPKKKSTGLARNKRAATDFVVEYHFVCGQDRGVTDLGDGRFKSGSWVVAVENVERSVEYGAWLALHESRADNSYRQGRIIGFEITSRSMVAELEEGVEFLVRATDEPMQWSGDATGEKGYRWASISSKATSDMGLTS